MKINTRFLKKHPLLALIPLFSLRRLIKQAALDEYPKGTVVYSQGEPCEAIYLVISGRCELRINSRHGSVVEAIYGPGEALGAREFLSNEPYRSTVTVLTHSILMRIPAAELERIFASKPSVAGRFVHAVFGRARSLEAPSATSRVTGVEVGRNGGRGKGKVGRLVCVSSLSEKGCGIVAERLAGAVQRITRRSVLLVELSPREERFSLSSWPAIAERCNGLTGAFCLEEFIRETDAGLRELRVHVGLEREETQLIPSILSHLGLHFDYVIVHLHSGVLVPIAVECMVQSDLAYVLLRQASEELFAFKELLAQLKECSHLRPVVYVDPAVPVYEFDEALRQMGRPVHEYVRGALPDDAAGVTTAIELHLNRLAREIGQCRIGIALSSGGAKGLAHIGVIQVLEENGIEVDVIAGSSMGAYVGSIWAHGYTGEAMERLARELESRWGLLQIIDPVMPPRAGFIRSRRVANRLRRSLGSARFSDLLRPLRVVATRLETMERVVFSSGEVVNAVEASIAIPGICVPVALDDELYIDGGIADPLPVDVLVEMGIERIIAVNTIPTPEQLRACVDVEEVTTEPPSGVLRQIGSFLNRHMNYFAYGNILDTMYRSTHGVQMRVAEAACRDADLVLWAIASDAAWHDFTHPGKYIALGRRVAEAHLEEIKALTEGAGDEQKPRSVADAA